MSDVDFTGENEAAENGLTSEATPDAPAPEVVPDLDGAHVPELGSLQLVPGSHKQRRRLGRGPGSGRGKTCGRGMKGQKSRSGVAINGFEGGQMPIHMRMPKRGFRNAPFRRTPVPVNLDRIQAAVDAGKLDACDVIDIAALKAAGIVRRAPDGVRILGRGELSSSLRIEATGASAAAIALIEKAGGTFTRTGNAAKSDGT